MSAGGVGTSLGSVSSSPGTGSTDTLLEPGLWGNITQPASPATGQAAHATTATTTTAAAAPTATPAASAPASGTCGLTNLSGCLSGDNFIAGLLGIILIAAGVFTFRGTRELITTAAKVA
jgi:hypothetical protein